MHPIYICIWQQQLKLAKLFTLWEKRGKGKLLQAIFADFAPVG
jgi:hypothetical protein